MNDLVQRLTEEQKIEASLRPEATAEAFKEAVDRGYVHVLFPGTRGGTELGVRLDEAACDLAAADFAAAAGSAHLEGELVLDYVKVRFIGDVDLATLEGRGRLQPVEQSEPVTAGS
jgi:hypothetical protein